MQTSRLPLAKPHDATESVDDLIALLKQYELLLPLQRGVLIDHAIASIVLSDEQINYATQQFSQQHQLTCEADVQDWLARQGITRQQFAQRITRNTRIALFKQKTWAHTLESYFLERKPKLDQVVYSLIRVKEVRTAQELYFRIQEGEASFSAIAHQHSQGIEAYTGGLLGPVELGIPHPAIAKWLVTSSPGQISPPTRLGEWVILLRLEAFVPAQLDVPMQQRLLDELFETWVQRQLAEQQSEAAS